MFKKILVAEDYESSNISVEKALEDLKIEESKYVYYCDDALQRVQIGIHEKQPFELLITDLSFDEDVGNRILKVVPSLLRAVKRYSRI